MASRLSPKRTSAVKIPRHSPWWIGIHHEGIDDVIRGEAMLPQYQAEAAAAEVPAYADRHGKPCVIPGKWSNSPSENLEPAGSSSAYALPPMATSC